MLGSRRGIWGNKILYAPNAVQRGYVITVIVISLMILPFLTSAWSWLGFLVRSPDPMATFQGFVSFLSYFAISALCVDGACRAVGTNSDEVVDWDEILVSLFTGAWNHAG